MNVQATTYTAGFEDGILNEEDYANDWLTTHDDGGADNTLEIEGEPTYTPRTGDRLLHYFDNDWGILGGWFNFTYESVLDMTSFKMWIAGALSDGEGQYIEFAFYNTDDELLIQMRVEDFADGYDKAYYFDHNGGQQEIGYLYSQLYIYKYIEFNWTANTNQNITYTAYNHTVNSTPRTISDNWHISYMLLNSNTWNNHLLIDDIIMESGTLTEGGIGDDITLCIGQVEDDYHSSNRYQEFRTDGAYTGILTEMKILYAMNQFLPTGAYGTTMSNYTAYVNGESIGSPTDVDPYNPYYAWLKWEDIRETLTNEQIIFEWDYNKTYFVGSNEVNYGHYLADDEYGILDMCQHNTESSFGDGNYTCDGSYSTHGYVICFDYYDTSESEVNFTFISNWNITNPIPYNNYWDIWVFPSESTDIYYQLLDSGGSVHIEGSYGSSSIFHIDNIWIDETDPTGTYTFYVCTYQEYIDSGYSFPYGTSDSYQFNVTSEGATSKNYNIKWNSYEYFLGDNAGFTYKAPVGELVYIKVYYNDQDLIFNNTFIGSVTPIPILNAFNIQNTGTYFIYMYWQTNDTKIPNAMDFMTTQTTSQYYTLDIKDTVLEVGDYQIISGTQNIQGATDDNLFLHVYKDGVRVETYKLGGNEYEFVRSYQCKELGSYYVELIFSGSSPDGYKAHWTVTTEEGVPPDEDILEFVKDLDPIYRAIGGVAVITIFLFLPMLIMLGSGKMDEIAKIPPLVYAMSGGVGVAFAVAFGLVDLWVPFFIIMIAIILTVMIWVKSHYSGG